ncbi:hypothetical protein HEP84_54520 [Streptomyces sp. RLB1-33]|nr:hypothetical protein [Streptomyces sp. RLB1-33]QIY76511.1 hypothetical protein HEP84_54520 [Streptomyces sp. RLB1-33]
MCPSLAPFVPMDVGRSGGDVAADQTGEVVVASEGIGCFRGRITVDLPQVSPNAVSDKQVLREPSLALRLVVMLPRR